MWWGEHWDQRMAENWEHISRLAADPGGRGGGGGGGGDGGGGDPVVALSAEGRASLAALLAGMSASGTGLQLRPQPEKCDQCGKKDARLKRFSACSHRWFCSPECAAAAWKAGHKRECKALRRQQQTGGGSMMGGDSTSSAAEAGAPTMAGGGGGGGKTEQDQMMMSLAARCS